MNPRNLYLTVFSALVGCLVALGIVYLLRYPGRAKARLKQDVRKAETTARSVWGRVANAAKRYRADLIHTERPPTETVQ